VARVKALQRRAALASRQPVLRLGDLIVDLGLKRAERAGVPVALTKTEFGILSCLAQAAGRPVSREHLLAAVWGYGAEVSTRTVETHVWRLRKKIGDCGADPQWIRNHSGLGYALETGLAAPLAA
jgi:two-component system response regulator MprA